MRSGVVTGLAAKVRAARLAVAIVQERPDESAAAPLNPFLA